MRITTVHTFAACSLACLLPPTAAAQSTDPTDADQQNIFVLDAFVVDGTTNQGYVASTSMSGTRLNQLVKDIPIPINIITEDFINDTGALSVSEALQFTAGVETEILTVQAGENPDHLTRGSTAFRLRGFVSQAVLRHGFRREGASDTINVTQVDVVRGPNALLYGIGNIGGVVNYVTRAPQDNFVVDTRMVLGRWGFYRGQLDVNVPVNDKLAIRLPVMYQSREDWYDHLEETKHGFAPVLLYKPTPNTRIQLEFDLYESDATTPESPFNYGLTADARFSFVDTTLFPQQQQDGASETRGFLNNPRPFRFSGPDTSRVQQDTGFLALLTHAFSDKFTINTGFYWSESQRDIRSVSLNVQRLALGEEENDRFVRIHYPWLFNPLHEDYDRLSAEEFHVLRYGWAKDDPLRRRKQARIEAIYQPEWFNIKHTLMLGVTYDLLKQISTNWTLRDRSNVGIAPNVDNISTSTTIHDVVFLNMPRPRFISLYDGDPIRFQQSLYPGEDLDFFMSGAPAVSYQAKAIGSYLIHQASFFNDNLRTIAGLRFDYYQFGSERRYRHDESLELVGDYSLAGRPAQLREQDPTKEVNYSIGVSYSPTEDIALFVLTASALDPEATGSQRRADGLIAPPIAAVSYEVGAKAEFIEGKVSGSFSVYRVERENVAVNGEHIYYPEFGLGGPVELGTFLGPESSRTPEFFEYWESEGRSYSVQPKAMRKDMSTGLDAQVFLINLIPNFETILSYSYNKYKIRDLEYQVFEGLQDGKLIFRSVMASEIEQLVPNFSTDAVWVKSRLNNDTPRHSFSIWNKYTFREGWLANLDIGLGLRWSDRREAELIGAPPNVTFKVTPDRLSMDLALGYVIKIGDRDLNLRLNISNLLNDDTVYGYNYTEPRRWRLSASYRY